jgi:2-deoxy-scyllo-inosamine dehydrogenase (SAM-dependent)
MRLFNTISVEISAACNRRCKFCPVSVYQRTEELMDEVVYGAIIGELASLKYRGRVEFYIYNEPMKNRSHLERCVRQARAMLKATLMVSTNGDYMKSVDDLEWLYEIGVNQVVLNAYTAKRYPVFLEWQAEYERRHGKLLDVVYSGIPIGKKALKVYDKSAGDNFGSGVFSLQNRAGSIPEFLAVPDEPLKKMCVKPFRLLNINWRGEAMICCNDYYADVPAGRVPAQSLVEIWNGPILSAYRKRLLKEDRTLPLCRTCDCHSGAYPANVDKTEGPVVASREEIESIYSARLAARSAAK